ncbi:hypothetical protein GCM10027435_02400 [Haloparvum alkalitolerans]|uniref:homing endonuclease associated repeat-containing protein n=1 Tax=Haloparvum alkalitolerans TaxID=1042953 RepID=UPI003CEF1D1A
MRYSDAELLDDVREVGDDLGRAPTLQEYRDHGSHSATTLYDRFGSWRATLAEAGFEPREPTTSVSKEELLADLTRVAEELGHAPTASEMNDEGEYWVSTYRRAFGTWTASLEAAGLESAASGSRGRPATDDELLAELERVADEHGAPPSFQAMEDYGQYGTRTYVRRFGSWNEAVEAAGFEPAEQDSKLSEETLIADLHRLADELGEQPVSTDVVEYGEHSLATYQRHFGSWSTAVDVAFDED